MKILRSTLFFCAALFSVLLPSFPLEASPVVTRSAGEEFVRFRENPQSMSDRPRHGGLRLDLSHVRPSAALRKTILAAGAGGRLFFREDLRPGN